MSRSSPLTDLSRRLTWPPQRPAGPLVGRPRPRCPRSARWRAGPRSCSQRRASWRGAAQPLSRRLRRSGAIQTSGDYGPGSDRVVRPLHFSTGLSMDSRRPIPRSAGGFGPMGRPRVAGDAGGAGDAPTRAWGASSWGDGVALGRLEGVGEGRRAALQILGCRRTARCARTRGHFAWVARGRSRQREREQKEVFAARGQGVQRREGARRCLQRANGH
jgi:hypothetical protein